MDAQEIMRKLQEPFPPEDIEWRVGSTNGDKTKGIALAYVTNRAIMNRLDGIFGPFGWRNEFREWKGNSQLCGISINFNGEWITKWDGADDSQTEAVKGGLSDAMKRAGYQWGIGRYLYNLENQWVSIEPIGKSYRLKQEPRLPDWALPDGYTYDKGGSINKSQEQEQSKTQVVPLPPKLIGEIKNVWIELGYKPNALDVQSEKLYGAKLTGLTEVQATEFLNRIKSKKEQTA